MREKRMKCEEDRAIYFLRGGKKSICPIQWLGLLAGAIKPTLPRRS
jgi:hypothetical protein